MTMTLSYFEDVKSISRFQDLDLKSHYVISVVLK